MPTELDTCVSAASRIRWDLVERHLDEAEFLFEQWQSGLHSPRYTLRTWASGVETRLLANLDALRIGGAEVAQRLLVPALLDPEEPSRATAAALGLCSGEAGLAEVLETLHSGKEDLRPALVRALTLADGKHVNAALLKAFESADDELEKVVYLEILTSRGTEPLQYLQSCGTSAEPRWAAAVLEASRRFSRPEGRDLASAFLNSNVPAVQLSAIKTGLTFGSPRAWEICLDLVHTTRAPDLLLCTALFGDPENHGILIKALQHPASRRPALWALGFAGTAAAGDACLEFLNVKSVPSVKLAADAIAWIAGLDLNHDDFHTAEPEPTEDETLPELEDDDLDADLSLDGVDDLPWPNPEAIEKAWAAHRRGIGSAARHLMGRPFSAEALEHGLRTAPLWRRHVLALDAGIRTGGPVSIATDRFSAQQQKELTAALPLPPWASINRLREGVGVR